METEFSWSFRTGGPPDPSDMPRVTIDSPQEDATLWGMVWIEGASSNLGSGGVVEVRIDGQAWETASGNEHWSLAWDTTETLDGDHTISARGRDSTARESPVYTVNISVLNTPNQAPVVTPMSAITVSAGDDVSIQVEATDVDGDDLIYSDDTELFDIDPSTGEIAFKPVDAQVGTWSVTVSVFDGREQTKVTFSVTVEPAEGGGGFIPWFPLQAYQALLLLVFLTVFVAFSRRRRRHNRTGGDRL